MRRPALVAAAAVVLLSVPALASWSTSGSGTGTAAARLVVAPGSPSAVAVVPTNSAIDVSFVLGTRPPGTTYTVTRDLTTTGALGPQIACSGLTASPCHDTGLANGTTYTYTVTAVLAAWSTAAATTAATATTGPLAVTRALAAGKNSPKIKFFGTGALASTTVTVLVCASPATTCTSPGSAGYVAEVTFAATANGSWGPTGTLNGLSGGYVAQATDGSRTSVPFSFTA